MKYFGCLLGLAACSSASPAPHPRSDAQPPTATPRPTTLVPLASATPTDARLVVPFGAPVPGRTTPGEMSVAWNGHAGLVTNSARTLLKDDVEGDSDFDTAEFTVLDEKGQATQPWQGALGKPGERVIASTGLPTANEYFSVRAAALPGPTLVVAAQSYSATASHYCHGGAWIGGEGEDLASMGVGGCAVEPLIRGAGDGDRKAVYAFGRNYDAHNTYLNAQNEGKTGLKSPRPTSVLMVRDGVQPWRRIKLHTARSVGVLALGQHDVAIASREKLAAGAAAIAVILVPWAGGPDQRVEIEHGDVGEPTIAFLGDDFVVVYAARASTGDAYRLQSAAISTTGAVTRRGAFGPTGAVAPALSAASGHVALAFTEETKPSRVHFGCGSSAPDTLPVTVVSESGVRARDPELALAPDGRSGALAYHAFTAKTSKVLTSAFPCGP